MSGYTWKPKLSLAEANKLLEGPGSPFETEWKQIKDRHVLVFKNQPASLRHVWLATQETPGDYVVYEGERYTYKEAHVHAAATVALLQSYGVVKGDRIVLCMRNFPEFIWLFFAAQTIGAVVVGVNAWSPFAALKHCTMGTKPVLVFLDAERAATLAPIFDEIKANGVKEIFLVRENSPPRGTLSYEAKVALFKGAKYPEIEVLPEDNATIFYTSGTTSLPKGVLATHRQVLCLMMIGGVGSTRSSLRRGDGFPQPKPGAPRVSILIATPLFHVTGCHAMLVMATAAAGQVTLIHKWDLQKALKLIKQEKVTFAGGVPFLAQQIIEAFAGDKDHSLQSIGFGGAPSPERMPDTLVKNLGAGVSIGQAYGMTETNATAVSNSDEDYISRPTSTGIPSPINRIKICKLDSLEECPVRVPGEILLWGANVCECYFGDAKATKESFLPGAWYRSGDIGWMDEEGFLYISDRAKEIIIRAGENISSAHVESKLFDHPAVREAAVLPLPDEKYGEVVGAIVTLHPGRESVTERELIDFVSTRLPKHEVPVMVWIRQEDMPRNPSTKILKTILKPLIAERWKKVGPSASKL